MPPGRHAVVLTEKAQTAASAHVATGFDREIVFDHVDDPQQRDVELVAVNYNPLDTQAGYLQAFDRQEGLNTVSNWLYLTGTRTQLQQVWHAYGLPIEILPAGSMIGHGDYAFVIDQNGHLRRELDFDPGPGTQATKSSFAAELTDAARQLLGQS